MPIAIPNSADFLIDGTIIDMSSESLSTSVRNGYRHRPESAAATTSGTSAFNPLRFLGKAASLLSMREIIGGFQHEQKNKRSHPKKICGTRT
jgi:hypothetical protein